MKKQEQKIGVASTKQGTKFFKRVTKGFWWFKKSYWKPIEEGEVFTTSASGAQQVCCDYTECTPTWVPTWTNPFNTVTVCVEGDTCHPIDCGDME